jgi:hypothetical protein
MTMTAKEVARERERRAKKRGGGKHDWVKIAADTTEYLRIGPPWKKDGEVWKDCYFHGYFKNKVYCAHNDIDSETGKTRRCVVDRRLIKLKGDKSKMAKKLWGLINQKSEGLWNVLVVKRKKVLSNGKIIVRSYEGNKFKILRLSAKWHNLLLDIFSDEDYRTKSNLGVTHPKYGRLIKVRRTGADRDDTNYSFQAVERVSPIFKSIAKRKKVLKSLNDLDELVRGSSEEELETFLSRMVKKAKKLARVKDKERDDDDEDDEEDEDADKDEDSDSDDEDEEDDDSESDEDEDGDGDDLQKQYRKMKGRVKSKKKRSKHDEEDDEEDEEEDDE